MSEMNLMPVLLLIGIVFLLFLFFKYIIVVRQQECVIVERLGKFHTILNSGLNILIPFVDQSRHHGANGVINNVDRIDQREVGY